MRALFFEKKTFYDYIYFFSGCTATMPLIAINIVGRYITLFTLFFPAMLACVAYSAVMTKLRAFDSKSNVNLPALLLACWFIIALFSSVFGFIYFQGQNIWLANILSYVPKILVYLLLLILVLLTDEKDRILKCFVLGVLAGCILNLILVFLEGVIFYSMRVSITNNIFSDFLASGQATRPYSSQIQGNSTIRAAGFNFDPSHLGAIIPIITLFGLVKKNPYLLFLCVTGIAFSQSTTAFAGSVIVILMHLSLFFGRNTESSKNSIGILLGIALICIAFVAVVASPSVLNALKGAASAFIDRSSYLYFSDRGSSINTNIRLIYIAYLPQAILYAGIRPITGMGFGVSSYSYINIDETRDLLIANYLQNASIMAPFDIENVYISYLFGTGVLGLILYVSVLFILYMRYRARFASDIYHLFLYCSLAGIIVSGFFYHYTLMAYHIIIIILSASSSTISENKTLGALNAQSRSFTKTELPVL